jgi:hypothetical protein
MYKNYALIENGVVVAYPVDVRAVSGAELPHNWPGGELYGKTYVFCHDQKPQRNWDEVEVETTPYFDQESGLWYRGYTVQKAPQEVIDERVNNADSAAQYNIASYLSQYSEETAVALGLSEEQKATWAQFRADVAAIVNQPGYPMVVTWPDEPDSDAGRTKLEIVRV